MVQKESKDTTTTISTNRKDYINEAFIYCHREKNDKN